jgi:hypothetical protein
MSRKSEIFVIAINEKNPFRNHIVRIPVKLPFEETLEKTIGFMQPNCITDISGALEEVDRFRQHLINIKNIQDHLGSEFLDSCNDAI